ncbi:MAG: hypothetical protein Q4D38_05450 [Planctomycetia bacterium]|nr:hypothetical protein [Planctomycetia bacterium]
MLAYIDPFTGSVILQVLAAGFLGFVAFFRPIWAWMFPRRKQDVLDMLEEKDSQALSEDSDDTAAGEQK